MILLTLAAMLLYVAVRRLGSKALFLVVLFLAAPVAQAGPHVYASSRDLSAARKTTMEIVSTLTVTDSDWSIFILSEKEWRSGLRKGQHGHTAYTLPGTKNTYISAQWIRDAHGSPVEIARILAHEWGHILCGCTDETTADQRGWQVLGPLH